MLFLDTSALLKRYVDEEGSELIDEWMQRDHEWAASAVARAEAEITICRLGLPEAVEAEQRSLLGDDWGHFLVVPPDDTCLARAAEIGCEQHVRTLDAIHLAAADRIPRPFVFVTFDRQQAAAARTIGFSVAGDAPA